SKVTFVNGSYTATPFGLPIITPITATPGGDIDIASGIDQLGGQTPTSSDALLATLNFTVNATASDDCPIVPISFRPNNPPSRITILPGQAVNNLSLNNPSPTALDNTPPTLTCPADVTVECPNPTDPAHTGTASAVDNCTLPVTVTHVDSVIDEVTP